MHLSAISLTYRNEKEKKRKEKKRKGRSQIGRIN